MHPRKKIFEFFGRVQTVLLISRGDEGRVGVGFLEKSK